MERALILAAEDDDQSDYRRRRPRHDVPPGTRIRRGLLEIGEDVASNMAPRSPKSVAKMIGELVVEHWEDDFVKDTFCIVVSKL